MDSCAAASLVVRSRLCSRSSAGTSRSAAAYHRAEASGERPSEAPAASMSVAMASESPWGAEYST